jgi:RNA recognition motif-containing protein
MASHRNWDPECKIYVGGLRDDANRYDLEDVFSKYGPVRDVWVARKPPGFAFVEMEDPRDAKDAVKGLDGSRVCGVRYKFEIS